VPEVNLHRVAFEGPNDDAPPGFRSRWARLAPSLGAEGLGATVYELPPGEAICPYHYEYPNEEWLIVLEGDPTLRTPDGERTLEAGDVVCFPTGPAGAHAVRGGTETARVVMLSTKQKPDVSVYPDSDKIGVFPGNDDDTKLFRRRDAVPYLDGEA
jgi:uncharacterized cupin superfamily protein